MKKLSMFLAFLLAQSCLGCVSLADEEPVELIFIDRYDDWDWEQSILTETLEEKFNVRITRKSYTSMDGSDWYTLAILSGEIPAYISDLSTSDLFKYAKQGFFKPLDMELLREYAPNMVQWWNDEWVDNWTDYCTVDGTLYAVPVLWSLSNHWNTVAIRSDKCRELSMETPHTLGEMEAFMAAAKEAYHMDYVLTTYDLEYLQFVLGAYDVYPNAWYLGNDGGLYWWTYHPNAKQAVSKLHDWYEAGYIDPEFHTNDWLIAAERFAQDKAFVAVDCWCDFVEAGVWGDEDGRVLAVLKESNPEATIDCVGTPSSEYGLGGWASDPWSGWFAFGNGLTDEQLKMYLKAFDYCSQDLEGLMIAMKGIEGVHYTTDEAWTYHWTDIADTYEKRVALGISINFPGNFNNYTVQYPFFTDYNKTETRKLAASDREMWNEWGTAFKNYCNKSLIDFIVGSRSMDEWDAFLGELNNQYHGKELVAEATMAAFDQVISKYSDEVTP